jgi:hypothetical protein
VFRVALRLLLAAALGAVPCLVRADVYRWVDDLGLTHYATTRDAIPRQYRDAAEVIKPPATGIANPSGARPPAPRPRPSAAPAPPAVAPSAQPSAPDAPTPPVEAPPPAASSPAAAPAPAMPPSAPAEPPPPESQSRAPAATPAVAAPESLPATRAPGDPRAGEIAELEGQIERDRETLRQLISTPRWDSAELASDPRVREIAERLPRLQAELAALRTEAER